MSEKKPWNSRMERDIIMHDDLKVSGLQGGKIVGEKMGLFSLIVGIPLLLIGLYALFNMILGLGFPANSATMILIAIVLSLGALFTIGGVLLFVYK
jgi:hypothetical protein